MKHKLERLTFDRESSIVAMQEDIESRGIKLILKAAGQKVGLAEVSIRLIREKAKATMCNGQDGGRQSFLLCYYRRRLFLCDYER